MSNKNRRLRWYVKYLTSIQRVSVGVMAVAVLGTIFLARSDAATFVAATEAESGVVSSNASVVSDTSASNGKSVKFAPSLAPRTIKLMPLGDSITLGSDGGYRTLLWKKIVQQDAKKIDFVGSLTDGPSSLGDRNHEGHSGWRIDQLRAQIDSWSNSYKPDLVLLHIGTNDISQNTNLAAAPSRLQDLVARICTNNPGVEVIVASLVPYSGKDSIINTYNAAIPGVVNNVKASGCKATFFDMHAYLTTGDLADGVHPTVAGYNKMAEAWYPVTTAAYNRIQAN